MENINLPSLALVIIIGGLGEVIKSAVGAKPGDLGWKGVYYVTYRAHGILVGALIGLAAYYSGLVDPGSGIRLPVSFGTSLVGTVLWGAASGGAAMVTYTTTMGVLRARIKQLASRQ